jgi:hypothetical protein
MSGVGGGNGTAKADSLMKGEYAFALLDPLVNLPVAEELEWSIYPNPAKEVLRLSAREIGAALVEIYDQNARLCLSRSINLSQREMIEIPIAELSNGAYNVRLISNEGTLLGSQSFVKED